MAIRRHIILIGTLLLLAAITAVYRVKLMQAQEEAVVQVKEYDLGKIADSQTDISRGIDALRADLREIKRDLEDIKSGIRSLQ